MSEFQEMLDELAMLSNYIDDEEIKLKPYKTARDNLRAAVLGKLNEIGITSAKSTEGHGVTVASSTACKIEDGEAFFTFIELEGRTDMLERRASASTIKEYVQETGKVPPGIRMETVNTLRFTRAKA